MNLIQIRKLIRKSIIESFEEFSNPFHIIVLIDKSDIDKFDLITEGIWVQSSEKGYWQRVDTSKNDF